MEILKVVIVLCVIFACPEANEHPQVLENKLKNENYQYVMAKVKIGMNQPIFVTHEMYLSLGLDVNLIRKRWVTFDFHSKRFMTMAKVLGPCYIRVSGTDADRMNFSINQKNDVEGLFPDTNFTMSAKDWDNLNIWVKNAGYIMIFGLNEQLRNGSVWDPTNAMELLDYSIKQGYYDNLNFELGNEPNGYPGQKYHVAINGTQLGKDYVFLSELLKGEKYGHYYKNSMLFGPAIGSAYGNIDYLKDFINVAGPVIKAITWHQYYGGGEVKTVQNYTDPRLMDVYIKESQASIQAIQQSSYPNLPSWQGETGINYGNPGTDIGISYVAGFMLLDKLGLNAQQKIELFIRQSIYGFWFGLVDDALYPTPAYWVSLLYKRLVGRQVLQTVISGANPSDRSARFYAHCTARSANYPKGAVTLYGMNLYDVDLFVDLSGWFDIDQYVLTPGGWGGITSRFVALNDEILLMPDDGNLATLKPLSLAPGDLIMLKPKTMGYFILKNAKAAACM